jgi:hypothetical protein
MKRNTCVLLMFASAVLCGCSPSEPPTEPVAAPTAEVDYIEGRVMTGVSAEAGVGDRGDEGPPTPYRGSS